MTVSAATDVIRGFVQSLDARRGDPDQWLHWGSASGSIMSAEGKEYRFVGATCIRSKGEWIELHGAWSKSERGSLSFKVEKAIACAPRTPAEELAWLGDVSSWPDVGRGPALGICSTLAEMRVSAREALADEDLRMELCARGSFNAGLVAKIADVFAARLALGEAQTALYDAGMNSREVAATLREFQPAEAMRVLKEDPFLFEERVEGIGFKRADQVAKRVGFDERHPTRIVAGVRHAVNAQVEEGHTWTEEEQAVSHALGELQVYDRPFILEHLREGAAAGKLARVALPSGSVAVANSWILESETMFIERFCNKEPNGHFQQPLSEDDVARLEPRALPAQRRAIAAASRFKSLVITGPAGTGKTFIAAAIARTYLRRGKKVVIAAPTGKAAKRMFQTLREQGIDETEPKTIHKSLDYDGKRWVRNAANRLDADIVMIDEASMVDIQVMRRLMDAMKPEAALVLIGDHNQLPPIGGGAILRDLCAGGGCEVVRLDEVVRQAGILRLNSLEVLSGRVKPSEPPDETGFTPWLIDDVHAAPGDAFRAVLRWFGSFLDALGPTQETVHRVQVISPQKEGLLGISDLNSALQSMVQRRVVGWDVSDAKEGKVEIRAGDKILQTKNDYDPRLMLMNGDIGTVMRQDRGGLVVSFPFRDMPVEIPWEKKKNLMLSYGITAHRCVSPDTIIETHAGLIPISGAATDGVVATSEGAMRYAGVVKNGPGKLLKITTKSGYSISVTPEHGMMAWTGGSYEKVRADELAKGQFLRLRLGAICHQDRLLELHEATQQDVRARLYTTPKLLDESVAEFLGLMVGDGTVWGDGFRLGKRHPEVVDRFAQLVMSVFGVKANRVQMDGCAGAEVHSVQLASWLSEIRGLNPNEKDIPWQVMSSPLHVQAAFLRGLFEDGTVNVKRDGRLDHVEFGSKHESICHKVQIMLLRFGIISSRRYAIKSVNGKKFRFHLLYVYGANAKRYAAHIGFISAFKKDRLSAWVGMETRYVIPVPRTRLDRKTHAGRNARVRGYVSRHAAHELGGFEEELKFHHDRIAKIEDAYGPSMCLTVPGHGRFLQNGFDGSNSQGSEWDHVIAVAHSSIKAPLKTRNLLYTTVTRAAKSVVVVGDKRGIAEFAANVRDERRRTLLGIHLAERRGT